MARSHRTPAQLIALIEVLVFIYKQMFYSKVLYEDWIAIEKSHKIDNQLSSQLEVIQLLNTREFAL